MDLYRPFDYLFYRIGNSYDFLSIKSKTYPSIPAMIASLLWFNLLSFEQLFIHTENKISEIIILIGIYILLIVLNLNRYNYDSFLDLQLRWSEENLKMKKVNGFLVFFYIIGTMIYLALSISNTSKNMI